MVGNKVPDYAIENRSETRPLYRYGARRLGGYGTYQLSEARDNSAEEIARSGIRNRARRLLDRNQLYNYYDVENNERLQRNDNRIRRAARRMLDGISERGVANSVG